MQERIIRSQKFLEEIFKKDDAQIRAIRSDEGMICINELMRKIQKYKYSLQDKKRILMCAANSPDWIAIFLTAMLYNKQLCAIDVNMDTRLVDDIIAEFTPELVVSERNIRGAIGFKCLEERIPTCATSETEPSLVLYTTGTTGRPKGVVMKLSNIMCNLLSLQEVIQVSGTEVVALMNPFSHSMGFIMMLLGICFGKESLILSTEGKTLSALKSTKIDVIAVPPVILNMLQDKKAYIDNMRRCRMVISGGAGVQRNIFQKYIKNSIRLVNGYGMTECCPAVAFSNVNLQNEKLIPLSWCDIKVSSDGELCVRGDSLCTEYYGGEPTADKDGWFHTRDIVRLVDNGFVVLYRMDNVLITESGFKTNLEDLENRIAKIGGICDCRAFIFSTHETQKLGLEVVLDDVVVPKKEEILKEIGRALHHYENIDKFIFSEKIATIGGKKKRHEEY